MTERDDDRAHIRDLLTTINNAWLKGDPESLPRTLAECFHDKVVFRGPDFREVARGVPGCIATYQDFLSHATVLDARLGEPQIDLAGDAAIAAYDWEMTYRLEGKEHTESGHDLFVFTRDDVRWLVRWRALLPRGAG